MGLGVDADIVDTHCCTVAFADATELHNDITLAGIILQTEALTAPSSLSCLLKVYDLAVVVYAVRRLNHHLQLSRIILRGIKLEEQHRILRALQAHLRHIQRGLITGLHGVIGSYVALRLGIWFPEQSTSRSIGIAILLQIPCC